MLGEAGIPRASCRVTNVCQVRPPGNDINAFIAQSQREVTSAHTKALGRYVLQPIIDGLTLLEREIDTCKPSVIIALGNTPLWALTGRQGITKWRGSMLSTSNGYKILPTYHPAAVLRQWSYRAVAVNDLRRANAYRSAPWPKPNWQFAIRPTYEQACHVLDQIFDRLNAGVTTLSFDIETRAGHISCAGIAWSRTDAICIPLMCCERLNGYWESAVQESDIVWRLYRVLVHPNARVVGQNIIYDSQYTHRWWGFVPKVSNDTMVGQHSLFADLPKALAFIASMYCQYYVYWKDEGRDFNPQDPQAENGLWLYNCLDCVYTYEVAEVLPQVAASMGLAHVYETQQNMFWPILRAMQLGVAVDGARRTALREELNQAIAERSDFIAKVLGHQLNVNSPKQLMELFYHDLGQPTRFSKGKKGKPSRPTLDDEALQAVAKREPLLQPLVNAIADIRTMRIYLSTFVDATLDRDGRMRCSYNIGGSTTAKSAPRTYRLSCSESAFGTGCNMQTIPGKKSKSVGKAKARGHSPYISDFSVPNLRTMFIPDEGYTFFDMDLERADLYTVVWEADDAMLKAAMHLGVDVHLLNAYDIDAKPVPPLEELVEGHPRYSDWRGPMEYRREFAKVFCHGTNYGGKPRTMGSQTGITTLAAERAQARWFGAHPGILKWHERVEAEMNSRRYITNRLGYRWYIFDRTDHLLPEALAWIPQSTTALVINTIWRNLYNHSIDLIQVLLQTHDSLSGQFRKSKTDEALSALRAEAKVTVPYDDPMVIPVNIKTSARSWGEC
jgi:DNA polymerase I-like protein with 3'-5' exonuclease and polymerase domains